MRILFMGTPDFAVASLRRLVADGHEVCGVFTQPDKPKHLQGITGLVYTSLVYTS